jgi:hypothetical protein
MGKNTKERQAAVYDKFKDYVEAKCRDRKNPRLSVRDFDLLKRDAYPTVLPVIIENVDDATVELFNKIEKFGKGVQLKVVPNRESANTFIYTAFVPFKDVAHDDDDDDDDGEGRRKAREPGFLVPVLVGFGFMLLAILALAKTSYADWRVFF